MRTTALRSALCATVPLLLAASCALAQAENVKNGGRLYQAQCAHCHSIDQNRTGPMHRNVFGRRMGSVSGFGYSPALRNLKLVWNESTLDAWLKDPEAMLPGQAMDYSVSSQSERNDIIAYLRFLNPPVPAK